MQTNVIRVLFLCTRFFVFVPLSVHVRASGASTGRCFGTNRFSILTMERIIIIIIKSIPSTKVQKLIVLKVRDCCAIRVGRDLDNYLSE